MAAAGGCVNPRRLWSCGPGDFEDRISFPGGEMVRQLASDQEAVARTAREVFPVASDAGDEVTADLLTARMQVHEKTAWMLRATAG